MRCNGSSIFKFKKIKININQVSRLSTAVRAKWQFLLCALNKYLNHLPFLLCLLRRHKGFIVNQGKWLKIKLLMSDFVTLASQRLMVLSHHFQVSQSVCTKKYYSLGFWFLGLAFSSVFAAFSYSTSLHVRWKSISCRVTDGQNKCSKQLK